MKWIGAFFLSYCLMASVFAGNEEQVMSEQLPDYVVSNDETQPESLRAVLRQVAEPIGFPMTEEELHALQTLEEKYDSEENMAGLAAPQIGISKQIIIFALSDDPELKKWRSNITDTMPKTIWLNPSYEPVGDETDIDYEACFSVQGVAGPVERYTTISYQAMLPNGEKVSGVVNGFLARIIQHETEHLQGKLFTDKIAPEDLMDIEEYRKIRKSSMKVSA